MMPMKFQKNNSNSHIDIEWNFRNKSVNSQFLRRMKYR